jgi:hypothetical protein
LKLDGNTCSLAFLQAEKQQEAAAAVSSLFSKNHSQKSAHAAAAPTNSEPTNGN